MPSMAVIARWWKDMSNYGALFQIRTSVESFSDNLWRSCSENDLSIMHSYGQTENHLRIPHTCARRSKNSVHSAHQHPVYSKRADHTYRYEGHHTASSLPFSLWRYLPWWRTHRTMLSGPFQRLLSVWHAQWPSRLHSDRLPPPLLLEADSRFRYWFLVLLH